MVVKLFPLRLCVVSGDILMCAEYIQVAHSPWVLVCWLRDKLETVNLMSLFFMKKFLAKKVFLNSSFTIVELAVIVAIVTLVVGISISNIKSAVMERRDDRRAADLNMIYKALNLYYTQYGMYPIGSARSDNSCWKLNENGSSCHPLGVLRELGFLAQVPVDPGVNTRVSNEKCDGSQFYSYKSDGNTYVLGAVKESSSDSCGCSFEWGSYEQCVTQANAK